MRRLLGALFLGVVVLTIPGMEVFAQKKKAPAKPGDQAAQTVDSSKLQSGEFVGYMKSTPGSNRVFTIEIPIQKMVAAPGKAGGKGGNANNLLKVQSQVQQAQMRLAQARSPQARMQAMQNLQRSSAQLQRAMAGGNGIPPGYRVETVKQEVEFQATENVKVRTMSLPDQFDDKGNPKKYTKEELSQLKGKDKGLVGFESSLEKLEPGQIVRLTLGVAPKTGNKEKNDDGGDAEKRMQVRVIVITQESSGATDTKAPAKPKKKK